ncbi:MAG: hypothetical protein HGB12_01955 [Bacteroidetes bacterium]|nr:hypothetical protein [Bacteroidota bacterium]
MKIIKTLPIRRSIMFTLLTFNFFLLTFNLFAQSGGVAINSTGGAADNSTMLDISSINQGMRIPRVALTSTTSAAPIANPVNSLLVYDSVTAGDVTPGFYYWDGVTSKWIRFSTGSGGGWSTSGNAGTDTTTNFIGTTDAQSWVMKTDNTQRMKISKTGNVGIGATNPASSAILDVNSATKGQLIPRMSSVNRDAIVSPATGLQIFNTDCNVNEYYTGICWVSLGKSLRAPYEIATTTTGFCAGAIRTYSITAVTNATHYTWTVPAEASITSGQGTTSITATFGTKSGSVCVTANNDCETSPATCIEISVDPLPVTPGPITGPASVARGAAPVSYYIASVAGATSYTWALPPGATFVSGQGTSTIVVNYPCSALPGNVSVTTQNACGTSVLASVLVITVGPVANAGPNVNIPTCPGTTIGGVSSFPTASGGSVPYSYSWSPTTDLSSVNIANPMVQCNNSYTTVTTTTYTVIVTDANACTASSSLIFKFPAYFVYTGSIQSWTVPTGVTSITIEAFGAQGGGNSGLGARMKGTFSVTPGQILKILVGQQGGTGSSNGHGGGGGTFVTDNSNNPLIVAGGGAYGGLGLTTTSGGNGCGTGGTGGNGGATCNGCGGGAGLTGNGADPSSCNVAKGGKSFTNGGAGGAAGASGGAGGFGGGGGGEWSCVGAAGGGGGYSGGGGGSNGGVSGGGGSFNGGINQSNSSGIQSGNGMLTILY